MDLFTLKEQLEDTMVYVYPHLVCLVTTSNTKYHIDFNLGKQSWTKEFEVQYGSASVWEASDFIVISHDGTVEVYEKNSGKFLYQKPAVISSFQDKFFFSQIRNKEDRSIANLSLYEITLMGLVRINEYDLVSAGENFFFGNAIINSSKGKINKLNEVLWQLNFCDLLQNDRAILHSEIIEHKGKLYFVLDGAENRGTFCVDIESGEVLAKYTALQGWLVKDGDYIYTIRFSETVVRLDTRTNEIVEWDIQELNGIGLIAEVAQNGFIYFVQNIGVTDPKVGVLDFDNKELVWSYSFTGNHGLIGSLKVHGNRLFVHTQDNTLHIFEKEL